MQFDGTVTMRKFILLFFFYCNCFAQNPPIAIMIDSITSFDSIPEERKFTIHYSIENLTDKEVSFFLNPNSFISNSRASMSRTISYKIFQNQEVMEMDNIFINKRAKFIWDEFEKAKTDEEKKVFFKKHMETDLDVSKEDLILKDLLILKPNEKRLFSKTLLWDKKRYFKIDDIEYYLDEIIPHYFELSINLMREEFKDKLSAEEFQKIMTDKSFVKGWFTSNKVEINFK